MTAYDHMLAVLRSLNDRVELCESCDGTGKSQSKRWDCHRCFGIGEVLGGHCAEKIPAIRAAIMLAEQEKEGRP